MYNDLAKRGKYSQVEHEDDGGQERSEDSDKAFAADRAQVESSRTEARWFPACLLPMLAGLAIPSQ